MFEVMWDGININSNDVTNMVDDLSTNVFGFQDPVFVGDDVSYWITAALASIATYGMMAVTGVGASAVALRTTIGAVAAFGGATASQVSAGMQPVTGLTRSDGEEMLHDMIVTFSQTSRDALELWSNNTFSGKLDVHNLTIIDYINGGRFLLAESIPDMKSVVQYYKSVLVARIVNLLWRTKQVYVISTSQNLNATGEEQSVQNISWTSPSSGRTFVLYHFDGSKQVAPPGILRLKDYDIQASQIAKSSGRSWEAAGNNYTTEVGLNDLTGTNSSSDSTFDQFEEQAAAKGVFTLATCDVGLRAESIQPYGASILPCCCGPNCTDTRAFIEAASLQRSWKFLEMCRAQLKGSTNPNFADIDYGITNPDPFLRWWYSHGTGQKAGLVIGMAAAAFLFIVFAIGFCIAHWCCGLLFIMMVIGALIALALTRTI